MSNPTHLKWLSRRGYSAHVKSSIGQSIGRRKMAAEMLVPAVTPYARQSDRNVVAFMPRLAGGDEQPVTELQTL
ncbi:hypothetical protein FV226_23370 [Methylobacterium sp. WL12]|uniref:hypothetical protein n=1 Tax=Methylobacterium sp. WL12 TaxID=2603890 RepID=UPI0011CB31BF|nr:hypothetical protein [Methylobacterium sp. WL12]TXM66513.1 hypothetical protein FV226_23370 [Methylobacterium sp. WL12]